MVKVTFNKGGFYAELKTRVDNYFRENNLKKTGNRQLYLKGLLLIVSSMLLYSLLLLRPMSLAVFIILCFLLGSLLAGIGFNVMHDACHHCYSSKRWVNNLCQLTLNALGGNVYIYKQKHSLHHAYTNIDGIDDDIAKSPLFRQCKSQKLLAVHAYQHLYAVPVYALSGLAWITLLDFTKYCNQKIYRKEMRVMNTQQHIIFWASKVLYILFYLIVPIYYVGWKWALGFTCMNVSMGLTLALIFQMAHVVEVTEFDAVNCEDHFIETEWAVHQLRSTANFAISNSFINWFCGGLNYQIEHHLFPGISHIHYSTISKITRQACLDFNLPYNCYPTVSAALLSHFRLMKRLGRNAE
jgi:linoleoyl-CoA desaturase